MVNDYWFSSHDEAVKELNAFKSILEADGFNLDRLKKEVNTVDKCFDRIHKSAISAYQSDLPVTKDASFYVSGRMSKKSFARKMLGNFGEFLLDAVVNSNQKGHLVPSNWCRSVHRAEYGIADLEAGSPDRIILDIDGNPFTFASSKFLAPSSGWDKVNNLGNPFVWLVNDKDKYPELSNVNTIGLFTNQVPPQRPEFKGGSITFPELQKQLDVTNAGQTSNQMFWNGFWTEMYKVVENSKLVVTNRVQETPRTPTDYQKERLLKPIESHVGAATLIAACGTGKMVCQTHILPRDRSINVIMSGARLILARQMNDSMHRDIDGKFNVLHIMTKREYHGSAYLEKNDEVFSAHAASAQEVANEIYKYVIGGNQYPLYLATIEPSLIKIIAAFDILEEGELINPETGRLYPWCENDDIRESTWKMITDLCREAIYDEAHNLVCGDHRESKINEDAVKTARRKGKYKSALPRLNEIFKRSTYWTATRQVNGSTRDMSNSEMFGEVMACVTPKESTEMGYVVKPHLIVYGLTEKDVEEMKIEGIDSLDDAAKLEIAYYVKCIGDAIKDCRARGLPTRLIVFVDDAGKQEQYAAIVRKHFANEKLYSAVVRASTPQAPLRKKRKVDADPMDTTASDVLVEVDAEPVELDRETIFNEFSTQEVSVLFNYAIVHEGIDIAGCTGVIFGRNLNQVWSVQAMGRAQRLLKEDRDLHFAAGDFTQYKKQYGLVYSYIDMSDPDDQRAYDELLELYTKITDYAGEEGWLEIDVRGNDTGTKSRPDIDISPNQDIDLIDPVKLDDELTKRIRELYRERSEAAEAAEELKSKINDVVEGLFE